jgi:hypothetical protein
MSGGYVPEQPHRLSPGVAEMLSDPQHYRKTPMEVVTYEPEPEPPAPSLWQRLTEWMTT